MRKRVIRITAVCIFSILFAVNVGTVSVANSPAKTENQPSSENKMVGKPAPSFSLKDNTGKEVALSDFKGKVVYLDIWASWCAPCLMQMKKAEDIKKHFQNNQDVVFLYISIDSNEEKWKHTIERRDIKGVHLISPNGQEDEIVSAYDVPQIPRYVLIDKEGKIADFDAKSPSNNGIIKDIEALL